MRKDEAKLQDKFIALLKKENILYYKTSGGLSYLPDGKGSFRPIINKKGFSDIIVFTEREVGCGCYSYWLSQTYFIEVKTDTSKLRDSQKEKFKELDELGFDCYILRPKHWEQAKLKGKLSFSNLLNEMEKYNV